MRVGGYVYVLGGRGATDPLGSIERAPILPGGELGAFATYGRALPGARADAAVAVLGQGVCLFGGAGAPRAVDCAPITSTGALGDFVTRGTLALAREGATAAQLGARSTSSAAAGPRRTPSTPAGSGGHTQPILRGLVLPDGRVDVFEALALNTHRGSTVAVLGHTVFNVGAQDNCSWGPGALERYTIAADGSLTATTSGAIASRSGSLFRYAVTDRLLRVGGLTGSPCGGQTSPLQAVAAAVTAPDATTDIPNPAGTASQMTSPGIVVLDDVVHTFLSDSRLLHRASASGAVTWTGTDNVLDVNRWGNFEVVGDRLYALGGGSGAQRLSTCAYATIPLASGTAAMGAFTSVANCQPVVTQVPAIALNDYVLRAGGYDMDGNAALTTTWRHPLR